MDRGGEVSEISEVRLGRVYCFSPQNAQVSDRLCSGLRQCQQKPFRGTSRARRRRRMSSISEALWSISAAVLRSSSSSDARW